MEKKEFKINIDATREKVWDILWNDVTYPQWTAPFSEGSMAESDWKKGSKVLFINSDRDGMIALIDESIPNEQMSFKHMGAVSKGKEDYDSPETKAWAGAMEEYFLKTVDGQTELSVRMDINDDYKDYFMSTMPKALQEVKTLSEK